MIVDPRSPCLHVSYVKAILDDRKDLEIQNYVLEQLGHLLVRSAYTQWKNYKLASTNLIEQQQQQQQFELKILRGLSYLCQVCRKQETAERWALQGSAHKRLFIVKGCHDQVDLNN